MQRPPPRFEMHDTAAHTVRRNSRPRLADGPYWARYMSPGYARVGSRCMADIEPECPNGCPGGCMRPCLMASYWRRLVGSTRMPYAYLPPNSDHPHTCRCSEDIHENTMCWTQGDVCAWCGMRNIHAHQYTGACPEGLTWRREAMCVCVCVCARANAGSDEHTPFEAVETLLERLLHCDLRDRHDR